MTDTEILSKIKAIVDDYIISNENGWLCGGDDNKTIFKAYYFEKILDVFANIPWEPRTNKNDIESALDILWSRCQHCEETEKAIMLLRVYEKKLRGEDNEEK